MDAGTAAAVMTIPRRRWAIGVLLGLGVLVNYFDRINLSVAGPDMQAEFGFGNVEFGWLSSAFSWTYAALQIPAGLVLDRLGVTLVGRVGSFLWALSSLGTVFITGITGLFVARAVLGVAEAPGFPANAKATGYWFPRAERAMATALFDAAAKFSNVIGIPVVALAVVNFGWRWGFGITAILSLAYFAAFTVFYRDPSRDKNLSAAEREHIRAGGATLEGEAQAGAGALLGYLLRNRKVWGLTVGFAAYGYSFYLFLTWLPKYLVSTMHMDILRSATYAAIPWACATVADLLVGGYLVDRLIQAGHDESRVRKTILVCGMLLGLAVFGATLTTNPTWAIVWISVALSGLAFAAPVGWSIPSLIAPRGGTATIGSIMNFANNISGIIAPVATGYIVDATGSFEDAFLVAGVVLLIGIVSFVFVLGRIEPIPEPGAPGV